ncbi:MAG: 23S rRNA (adenine(2503)-C(2))-methyltransferase RlmN [Verrucomicrobiae bacterium]|nr:23S rRNA (adenine(2503)-C(2))-methyltransferase RlmN [Verrucomicrobiae bacterium]
MTTDSPAPTSVKPSAIGLEKDDWIAWLSSQGEPAFRAQQILDWLFRKRVDSFDAMTNLGAGLRQALAENFRLNPLESRTQEGSIDTTSKLLFRLHDGRYIETVVIPASPALYGEKSDRRTLCVSSQVGCAYDCKFCASGLAGFTRNLDAAEIVGQILQAEKLGGEKINNLVFMGMGEPLANLTNLTKAIRIINAEWGVGIGARHLTISTSGLAPQIEKLAQEPLQFRLAISLHGASDEVREQIMPVNKKYPIDRLFKALEIWQTTRKQKITFEYILIQGINDSREQAELLAKRARKVRAKVNLIPYNTVEGLPWKRPEVKVQEAFLDHLLSKGVQATLRREKGHDIAAACGQLRLKQETDEGIIEAPVAAARS